MTASPDPRVAEARAGIEDGVALLDAGKLVEAVARFAAVVHRFEHGLSADLQAEVAEARNYVAYALAEGTPEQKVEGIKTYDDVIAHHSNATDRRLRKQLANAMFNRAMNLWDLGRSADAARGFSALLDTFEDDPAGKSYLLPQARVEMGTCLADLGQTEEALATFDDVVERFDGDDSLETRTWAAAALERKAYTLKEANRLVEAIAVCDELVSRFAYDPADPVRLRVLVVMCWKAQWLELLDQRPRPLSTFNEILDRFPGEQPPERAPSVEWARRRLAAAAP